MLAKNFNYFLAWCATLTLPVFTYAETFIIPSTQVGYEQQLSHSFPQHTTYTEGTIISNHVTQAELDTETETFYDIWKRMYLVNGCGLARYYVSANADGIFEPKVLSISEGHGYGMIITVLMAGYDPEAKAIFDGLYYFFKDHHSNRSPYLMGWKQTIDCQNAPDGNDTATDGDMDIAYALLLADKQWGSTGTINYYQEAIRVIKAIMDIEINPKTYTIMLGSWVSPTKRKYYYGTRTSDFMINHLKAYLAATGDTRWTAVENATYTLINTMQTTYSPKTGLLPDFIQNINTKPKPAVPGYSEGPYDGHYYYNACRDPWRLAIDYLISGNSQALTAVNKINDWIREKTENNPLDIHAGYKLNGKDIPENNYIDMAFVAPFGVGAMVDARHQEWLNGIWDVVVNTPLEEQDYYGNTLKMLSMIVMSGNWWTP